MLIVEDDVDVRAGLQDFFELEGYAVSTAEDGDQALSSLRSDDPYDIVLLDIMLPKRSGFDVLQASRALGIEYPVLMLTARGEEEDVLRGFDLGADDYVVKPFNVQLLLARVRAILARRMPPGEQPMDVHQFGCVEVNFSTHEVYRRDEEIHLTVLEFDLLKYFIQNEGRVVTRELLLENVWGVPGSLDTRTVDRHIASLRKKIEPDPETPVCIRTVYGRGYRFKREPTAGHPGYVVDGSES